MSSVVENTSDEDSPSTTSSTDETWDEKDTNSKKPIVKNCQECGKTFKFRRHFEKHVEGHKRNNCQYCDELISSRKELVRHLAEMHGVKLQEPGYQCKFCDKRFIKAVTLYNHYTKHADGQSVCTLCGEFFECEKEFALHKEEHAKERPWSCELCNESFSRRQQYLVHMKGHEKYQCNECGENFSSKKKFAEHNSKVHQVKIADSQCICSVCGLSFARPILLQQHFRIHTGEKPLACKDCKKLFRTPKSYRKHLKTDAHLRVSRGEAAPREVACDQCDKRFASREAALRHRGRTHGAAPLFACEACGREFGSRSNLERHRLLHAGAAAPRTFVCDRCGLRFRTASALQDHAARHSEGRPFLCGDCGKAFKSRGVLRRHAAAHSEGRPFACGDCGRTYKQASHLRRHRDAAHGGGVASKKKLVTVLPQTVDPESIPTQPEVVGFHGDVLRAVEVSYDLDPYPIQESSARLYDLVDPGAPLVLSSEIPVCDAATYATLEKFLQPPIVGQADGMVIHDMASVHLSAVVEQPPLPVLSEYVPQHFNYLSVTSADL